LLHICQRSSWGFFLEKDTRIVSITHSNGKWRAFDGEREVARAECGHCVIEAMRKLTKNSTVYTAIHVTNNDGTTTIHETGRAYNDRQNQKN
jgi:hypothetical protein